MLFVLLGLRILSPCARFRLQQVAFIAPREESRWEWTLIMPNDAGLALGFLHAER